MLTELRIQGYAVIDDLSLRLGPGLNVLTGETGAGKSIIVGALSLLLGERASADDVREGAARALVEAVFDIEGLGGVAGRLEELGVDAGDGLLILKREVQAEGRNRAWVNGSPATASMVWELGSHLVDLHGQHEHQTLLRRDEQRAMLDAFAGASAVAVRVAEVHGRVRTLETELEGREERRRELETRADFLRFQLGEIEEAAPEPGEEEVLKAEAHRLEHAQELAESAQELNELLYAGDDAVNDRLARARNLLRHLVRFDAELEEVAGMVEEAFHQVGEVGRRMGDYAGSVEQDPARLDEIGRRQDLLFRLKRKYGPELEDVIETGRRVREELDELESAEHDLSRLQRELAEARDRLDEEAAALSDLRRSAAGKLAGEVVDILPELGMPGGTFVVHLEELERPSAGGKERVEFRVALNPGFEPRPLGRVASGGELSRVMLALKSILARVDRVPTLVFDEIDAGIGGVVATGVAAKLAQVAELHQVFVITHLPQLASRAGAHLRVEKSLADEKVSTVVRELGGEERVEEIARMLGGDPESEKSRDHARELLRVG